MTRCAEFIAAALATCGTPFVHRGRTPGVALDCAGVVKSSLAAIGVGSGDELYGTSAADVTPHLAATFDQVPLEQRGAGDVVAIWWAGAPRHLAILVGRNSGGVDLVVHALARVGHVAVEPLTRAYRVHSCWRLREAA